MASFNWPVVKGTLRSDLRQRPTNKGQPFSRPVLESGTAIKTVYLSKASTKLSQEALEKALDGHERTMRSELQDSGRIVRKVTRTLAGAEGDVRLLMTWEILGAKRTKLYRKRQNAGIVVPKQGSADQSGRSETPEGAEQTSVPL